MAAEPAETGSGNLEEMSSTLRYVLGDLKALEHAPIKNKAWGSSVCKESRAAHLRALRDDISGEDACLVAGAIAVLLPSLETLAKKVPDARCFLNNVDWRVRSLMSIGKGGNPIAPPDATPEEQRLVAVYVNAKRHDQELSKVLSAHAEA